MRLLAAVRGAQPPPRLLLRAAGIVALVAALVGATWWTTDAVTAQALYLGVIFMVGAIAHLSARDQLLAGLAAGAAVGAGALVAGNLPLLAAATLVACLVQWPFNRRSVGVAALLPVYLVTYATSAPEQPLRVVAATWAGAGIAIAIGLLARVRGPAHPAADREARWHALALAAGCLALVLFLTGFGMTRGTWAVLTLCLVFLPAADEARVRARVVGTSAGALLAACVVIVAPTVVCLALAALFAVLTVAYALVPDDLRSVVFTTPTVLLLFGAGQTDAVLSLAAQRVLMTAVGGALALLLMAALLRVTLASGR